MRYLCLVHFERGALDHLTPEDRKDLDRRSMAYDVTLKEAGRLIDAQVLQPAKSAVLVRVRNGKASTTDGPFAETKEQLGGFLLIEARDLNEAVRLATSVPMAAHGTIEVRPILNLGARA